MRRARSVLRPFQAIGLTGLLFAMLFTSSGCRQGWILPAPGPILRQQSQAIINDPYPQNEIGPYEAASRPPGYQNPLPEAVRNRIHRDSTFGFGR